MKELKRIDPISSAHMHGLILLVAGLILGILVIAIDYSIGAGQALAMYGAWAVLLPVLYAVMFAILGMICGFVGAVLYNFFAKRIGGIKIELK